jgi:hypothetical protein
LICVGRRGYQGAGQVGQALVAVAGLVAQDGECLVDVDQAGDGKNQHHFLLRREEHEVTGGLPGRLRPRASATTPLEPTNSRPARSTMICDSRAATAVSAAYAGPREAPGFRKYSTVKKENSSGPRRAVPSHFTRLHVRVWIFVPAVVATKALRAGRQ